MPDEKVVVEAKLDTEALKAGLNPSGLDPDLEIKANEYAKRDWQITIEPLLTETGLIQDLDLVVKLQNALFNQKYTYLENAQAKEVKAKEAGLRWGLKA